MKDKGKFTRYKRNRQIKIKDKLKFIEIAKIKGNAEAAKLAGVSTKSIRRWKENEYKFKQVTNPQNLIILHKGNPHFAVNEEINI